VKEGEYNCVVKGDWLAGIALVCLFEGSWVGLLGFSGVALVSQGVYFGWVCFFCGLTLASIVYSLCN
jgi:hypothetical protein